MRPLPLRRLHQPLPLSALPRQRRNRTRILPVTIRDTSLLATILHSSENVIVNTGRGECVCDV